MGCIPTNAYEVTFPSVAGKRRVVMIGVWVRLLVAGDRRVVTIGIRA